MIKLLAPRRIARPNDDMRQPLILDSDDLSSSSQQVRVDTAPRLIVDSTRIRRSTKVVHHSIFLRVEVEEEMVKELVLLFAIVGV